MFHVAEPTFEGINNALPNSFRQPENRTGNADLTDGGFHVGLSVDFLEAQTWEVFVDSVDEVVLDAHGQDVPQGNEDGSPGVAQEVKDQS